MSSRRRMMHLGNAIGVWSHRAFKGRFDAVGDQTVLMLTVPGRRTGRPRSTMVRYLDHDGGYLVWGTGSGSPTDPDWFRNLRRTGSAAVEIGTRGQTVVPQELRGQERDAVWREVILAQAPTVAKYAAKAGRTIPVAHLHPTSSPLTH